MDSENNSKIIIKNLILFMIILGCIIIYTNYSIYGNILKISCETVFLLLFMREINFKNFKFLIPLFLFFIVIPIILLAVGGYQSNNLEIIKYVIFYLFNMLVLISIADNYKYNVNTLVFTIYLSIISALCILYFLYGGISLNVFSQFSAMIDNQRYGNNISTQRVAMGFLNVNQLGMFASVSLVMAINYINKKKNILINVIILLCSILLILNSGSRTPIIAASMFILMIIINKINNKKIKSTLVIIIFLSYIMIVIIFLIFIYYDNYSQLYLKIDDILSYRISFSKNILQIIRFTGTNLFGIGPMSSSTIQNLYLGNSYAIDSSVAYYLLTIGYVGLLGVLISLINIFNKIKDEFSISLFIYYLFYSVFENVLFTPNSALTTIILGLVFTFICSDIDYSKKVNGFLSNGTDRLNN